jgi:hypothetical protein
LIKIKNVTKFLNKKEVKIFLTFFIIYSLFVHWIGWNENSRFDLVRAIVDEKRFKIDSFFNNTGDRSLFQGHYYSDKAPGSSFLAVPTYATWNFIYNNFVSKDFKKINSGTSDYFTLTENIVHEFTFFWPLDPGFLFYSSMILVTVFTSSLFGALTVVLIYKFSNYFTKSESKKIALAMMAGFGTLLFPSSLIFMEGSVSAFFAFASFYFLFKAKLEKTKNVKFFLLSGLLAGFGVVVNELVLIVALTNLVYVLLTRKEMLKFYIIGAAIGVMPLLAYNYTIFHTMTQYPKIFAPFVLPRWALDTKVWGELGTSGIKFLNPYAILKLLFYPEVGLFVFSPILLLSLIGLFYLYKKFRTETTLILLILITNVIVISSFWGWDGGVSIGPRNLAISIPFLVLPLIEIFNLLDKRFLKIVFFILLFYSVSVNFLMLQDSSGIKLERNNDGSLDYSQMNSFKVTQNTIYDYYLPFFLKEGSRSKILEGLITDWTKTDIRDFKSQQTSGIKFIAVPFGFLTCRLQTLPIALMILIFFAIWRKEIVRLIPKRYCLLLYLLPLLIALLAFNLETIHYGNNWYPVYKNATYTDPYRWMSQNGTIYIFSSEKTDALLNFSFVGYGNRSFDIVLNNKIISSYYNNLTDKTNAELLKLNKGENVLVLHSQEGCRVPSELNDTRCLSIGINNFTILKGTEIKDKEIVFGRNWFNEENISGIKFRWMSENATIFITSPNEQTTNLNLLAWSYYKPRTLIVSFGNNSKELNIGENATEVNLKLNLANGINHVLLISKEGCDIPQIISNSNDNRCLSFVLGNFTIN